MIFIKTFFIDNWLGSKFTQDNRLSSKIKKTCSVSYLPREAFLLYLKMAENSTLICASEFLLEWSLPCSVLRWARLIWKSTSWKEYGRSSSHVMKSARSREVSSHNSFWMLQVFLKISVYLIVRFWRSSNSMIVAFIWACSFVISSSSSSLISPFTVVYISFCIRSCCSSIFLMSLAFWRPISRTFLGVSSTLDICSIGFLWLFIIFSSSPRSSC